MEKNDPFLIGGVDFVLIVIAGFIIFLLFLFFKWIYDNWKYAGEIVNDPEQLKYWEGDYD